MVVDVCSCEPLEGDVVVNVVVRSPCTFSGAYGAPFARRPAGLFFGDRVQVRLGRIRGEPPVSGTT
jgi:hypothetical protein